MSTEPELPSTFWRIHEGEVFIPPRLAPPPATWECQCAESLAAAWEMGRASGLSWAEADQNPYRGSL